MSRKQVGRYLLDRRIGKGSYAQVWLGHCEDTLETVAVKVISRQTVNETAQLRQEVAVLKKIDHENIVKFRDLKKSVGHYYLVLEYCEGGDLARFIQRHGRLREDSARRFLQQLSAGLMMLHRLSFIHRDLKPQNILLTTESENAVLKIADFGFARVLDSTDMAATVCGSPLYMAPEILRHERYDARADLWSLGAIVYELLFGRPPYTGSNPMQLLANIENAPPFVDFPECVKVSAECESLLRLVLVRDPVDRILPDKFFSHEFNLGPGVGLIEPETALSEEEEDLMLVEETSPVNISTEELRGFSPKAQDSPKQETPPVVLLTGLFRVLSEALGLQTQGPLVDLYASTQTALGVILRHIAQEVCKMISEDEMNAVDAIGIIGKSCQFIDSALDEIVDKQALILVEIELKQSLEVAAFIQTKLSYRGFTQSAKPLRWIYAFMLKMVSDSLNEKNQEHRKLLKKGSILLIDFLMHELAHFDEDFASCHEDTVKDTTESVLRALRCQLAE